MKALKDHLRNAFLAGILGFVPLAITIVIAIWIDEKTRVLSEKVFGRSIPVVGFLIAIALVYVTGLFATTFIGKFFLKILDSLLRRVPVLSQVYEAWKQIALTPGGTEGTFSKVVLLRDETSHYRILGFTSGRSVDDSDTHICVFVPNAPNPTQGRMLFVERTRCMFLNTSTEEAFKWILSTGNYTPEGVRLAIDISSNELPAAQAKAN